MHYGLTIFPTDYSIHRRRDAGITRALFFVPPVAQDEALGVLDRYAELARAVG